jgi:hypothetical protein
MKKRCSRCRKSFLKRKSGPARFGNNHSQKYCGSVCRRKAANEQHCRYAHSKKGLTVRKRHEKSNKRKHYYAAYRKKHHVHLNTIKQKSRRLRQYGLTPAQFEALLKKQNYCCAICKRPFKKIQSTHDPRNVDHCHKTKKVRGVLCLTCNYGLGFFQDEPRRLKNALRYLKHNHKTK